MVKLIIQHESDRYKAVNAVRDMPLGKYGLDISIRDGTRSLQQNATLWKMLTAWAASQTLHGQKYDKESWKCVLLQAFGKEAPMLPQLDEQGYFPMGLRSSQLTVREMSEFLEFIIAESAQRGITFPWLTEDAL